MSGSAATRRRILVVSPFAPRLDGRHGGSRTIAHFVANLAHRHDVALVYLRGHGEPPLDPILGRCCDLVAEFKRPWTAGDPVTRWARRLRLAWALLRGKPSWVTRWWTTELALRLDEIASDWEPDVAQLETHVMGQYLPALRMLTAPKVLVFQEPGASVARGGATSQRGPARLLGRLETRAWARFEQEALSRADAAVTFTARDREALACHATSTPIHVIPIGIEVPLAAMSALGHDDPRVLFFGNFFHPPNVEAAQWLVEAVLPRVRERIPGVAVDLVGPDSDGRLAMMERPGVNVVGEVADLGYWMDAASVVALPLRTGGGMRVKTLEALAAGKAVVATSLAVAGLEVEHGQHLLVADGTEAFADAVAVLVADPVLRTGMGKRARAWASLNLGWEGPVKMYEALYESLLDKRRPGFSQNPAGR
jgi:polysaccharide biosynthesis protein PslH